MLYYKKFKKEVYRQFEDDVVLKRELNKNLKNARSDKKDEVDLSITSVPIKALKMMKDSKNAKLKEASVWIELADQAEQLPEVSKKLLELQKF